MAATNPFGWWSANPSNARYGLNPAARVHTPTASDIRCAAQPGHGIACSPQGTGQLYFRVDTIHLPAPNTFFTRAHFLKAMAAAEAAHQVSAAMATRFRHDLARVPDSFFVELRLSSHYGTYGGGNNEVPPAGIPEYLACGQAGSTLRCRNLNGDAAVPLGAGVYAAQPGPGWRPNPRPGQDYSMPPGIHFTRAEYRVLADLILTGRATSGTASSSAGPRHAPRTR